MPNFIIAALLILEKMAIFRYCILEKCDKILCRIIEKVELCDVNI